MGEQIQATELVGCLKLDGETSWMGFLLPRDANLMLEEAANLIDGSYMPGQTDSDDEPPFVTIEFRRKPAGFVDSLPEFQGW